MSIDGFYHHKRIFVTGHTGFKGSWLSEWLRLLGADVRGFSSGLPTEPNHFSLLDISMEDVRGDVNDFGAVAKAIRDFSPEIVFHLAAQPLVRYSYEHPLETFATNVTGTANVLQACLDAAVPAAVVVTTDKCYENKEWPWGYRENDRLGGHDPYSASKACSEIVAACFRQSFPGKTLIATCRAGNVVGGGDWAGDRLIPDLARAAAEGKATTIRMPHATRPWQHVLEPLRGYLMLGRRLLENGAEFANAWNFGPGAEGNLSVAELIRTAARYWDKIRMDIVPDATRHEANLLMLDCSQARQRLGWKPVWGLEQGIEKTISWYKDYYERRVIRTQEQIKQYMEAMG